MIEKPDDIVNKMKARPLDPDVRQRSAAAPDDSIWVNASAGTGKTKVLTDRVLRLLLPKNDGRPDTPPHKILCLTFTKAGANEMAQRINTTLGHWAVMPEEKLQGALKKLLGRNCQKEELTAARQIFAKIIDMPGGLKIMTIHSFCQSVLSRFPLEAGIAPHMKVLEESQAARLLQQARDHIVLKAQGEKTSPLHESFLNIASILNEERFTAVLRGLTGERRQLSLLIEKYFSEDGLYTEICHQLGVTPDINPENIMQGACEDQAFSPDLYALCDALAKGKGKDEIKHALSIKSWLQKNLQERASGFEEYKSIFMTQENTPRTRGFPTKETLKSYPEAIFIIATEFERLKKADEAIRAASCALYTRDMIRLGTAIIERYQILKYNQASLDYDDLIFKTLDLFKGKTFTPRRENMAAWVLYKLDQGIDHVLVDEAQDTNPEQWQIINALTEEFSAGKTAHDKTRTAFIVGDDKQSIYSFQRASPEEFSRNHRHLEKNFKMAGLPWNNIDLDISFRSAKSVLAIVDATFKDFYTGPGMGAKETHHQSFRIGQAGRVELWPLIETAKEEKYDPWEPPVTIRDRKGSSAKTAELIADRIAEWLNASEILPARGRVLRPGDIMILVRTRNAFVDQLSRALKNRHIPVSGTDRMILNNHIAVEDLLSFADFALAPHDDLSLATILKSPLINLSEADLYTFSYKREGSLWNAVRNKAPQNIVTYLQSVKFWAARLTPFDFINALLQNACPADQGNGLRAIIRRLGRDAQDPLNELLASALSFERTEAASLQSFIHWQKNTQAEIKREHEDHADQVRIMTIHGAKGLQAPVVILPDTTRTVSQPAGKADMRFLWPNKTGLSIPLFAPSKDKECQLYTEAAGRVMTRLDEEYRRLLYVAMTRAEDRLYITGYKTQKEPKADSWYYLMQDGIKSLADVQELEDGTLRLENLQTRQPDRADKTNIGPKDSIPLPAWIFNDAPEETKPAALATLSSANEFTETESPVNSPLQKKDLYRFRRGNITHKLLEVLPTLPLEKRASAAQKFMERYAADLPDDIRVNIIKETLHVLDHPEFSAIFGSNSVAEVSVAGFVGKTRVNGRIDRLLVTANSIYIVDYKTNRPPPLDPSRVPVLYKNQLRFYADLLRRIYPGRTVHAALLWTDGPVMMPVDTPEI